MNLSNRTTKLLIANIVLISLTLQVSAVKPSVEEVLDSATVEQQIEYVLKRSTTYEEYKVIKTVWINELKSNILDSLASSKASIQKRNVRLDENQSIIDSLHSNLESIEARLLKITQEKDSISFFGILVNKTRYNTLVYSLFAILLGLLIMLFVLFKRGYMITNQTKHELSEMKQEFELHRQRTREREERLARRHLDEILKYKK